MTARCVVLERHHAGVASPSPSGYPAASLHQRHWLAQSMRRLAKDWECLNRSALAVLRWSSIRLMLRKLCQTTK
jgi:hypothetical protein